MVRGYKLRLGDGTTFAVDEKGLVTWLNGGLVDDKTRVQAAGSNQWLSIRQLIAAERAAQERLIEKRIAAQHAAREEVAAAERAVAEERAAEERAAVARAAAEQREEEEAGLALARQAHEERIAAEREARLRAEAVQAEEAERLAAQRRAEAERRAAQERAEMERRVAEERAAEEVRAQKQRRAAEKRAAAERAEAERRAAEERAAAERAEAERRAAEERRLAAERAEAERAAAERAEAERRAAEERAAAERAEAERRAAEERRLAAERADAERADAERAAAERRAAEERRLAVERAEAERRAVYAARQHVELEPLAVDIDLEPIDEAPPAPRRIALRPLEDDDLPREVTLFEDGAPLESMAEEATPVEKVEAGVSGVLESLRPVMEPIDERVSAWTRWQRRRAARRRQRPPLAESVARAGKPLAAAFETGARWTLAGLESARTGARKLLAFRRSPAPMLSLLDGPPSPAPVRPADSAPPAPAFEPPLAQSELSAVAELVDQPLPVRGALVAPIADAPRPRPATPAPTPPLPLAQLPVIPFAGGWKPTRPEEREERAEPEADEPGDTAAGMLRTTWVWTRRAAIAATLVAGAVYLARRQDQWVPQTRVAAVSLFSGMDELKTRVAPPPSPSATALGAAVATSSEQLPVLGVETIQLIMASAGQALEPVEVLRRTFTALERARPALAQPTAQEIDALTAGLAEELPRPDQAWLRDYLQRVRARTVTLRYEDTKALWLISRAARRLPAERLQRMQEVLANAVSLGLQPRTSAEHAQS